MSYRDLDVWKLSGQIAVDIHRMTLEKLPKFEMYEEGSQIRRSSKSVISNITEGYGRRRYKAEDIRFLVFALASCDETNVHLDLLYETGSLADEDLYRERSKRVDELGKQLNRFIQGVEEQHRVSI